MLEHHLDYCGQTPLIKIKYKGFESLDIFAKLEMYNPTGSIKDRAAEYILRKGLEQGSLNLQTTIIESSSGNFGVALASFCRKLGMKFICVVDPYISPINEMLIRSMGACVVKVTESDSNGGYLLQRIKKVKEILDRTENSFWVNQYANFDNASAYYHGLAGEISSSLDRIDYLFLGVSSGGTITGVSRRIKELFPDCRVIAVDIHGSVIFGHPAKKRCIPGIGSSMKPEILDCAKIDGVVMVDEAATIRCCHELLEDHCIFAGGSSGSVVAGIKQYFTENPQPCGANVVTVFPDRGERYIHTIYDATWCHGFLDAPGVDAGGSLAQGVEQEITEEVFA